MAKELNLRGRHNGEDKRQMQPKVDGKPLSPKEIDALYKKDRIAPGLNVDGGDGLVSKAQHDREAGLQRPQFMEDGYLADTGDYNASTGRRTEGKKGADSGEVPEGSWLRGGGKQGAAHVGFDAVGNPKGPKGPPNTATGQDVPSSPFSAAAHTYSGEGPPIKNQFTGRSISSPFSKAHKD
jgi:hypothetical protein